jgi:hypothetical protein
VSGRWQELLQIGLLALAVRAAGAWALGGGAPFGPDGTGAEAAVHLGGHLYPWHIEGIRLFGSARALSIAAGTLTAPLLADWGRRVGLGTGGGWLWACLPLAVYTGVLSAGDAPALLLVVAGAWLTTFGRLAALLGGALALSSVAVKPIALPALALLSLRPWSLLGLLMALPAWLPWLQPLLQPRLRSGLLGSWWLAGQPEGAAAWASWLGQGAMALLEAPPWAGLPLLLLARPRGRLALAAGAGLLCTGALFGEQLSARYLSAALAAGLPLLRRRPPLALALLMPSALLMAELGAERARRDPESVPPALPTPGWLKVGPLFDECSADGATAMRRRAAELALELPPGARVEVEALPHGRQGELTWPLQVARPDVIIELRRP